jgi:micrococcal nuclease
VNPHTDAFIGNLEPSPRHRGLGGVAIPAVALLFAVASCAEPLCDRPAHVLSAVDGDTLRIELDGRRESLRVACIDTPEIAHRGQPGEPFGPEATAHTTDLTKGQTVCLVPDREQPARDRHGRLLAYVELADGRDLGSELLREGLARTYRGRCERRDTYRGLEEAAAESRRGLWNETRGASGQAN